MDQGGDQFCEKEFQVQLFHGKLQAIFTVCGNAVIKVYA